MRIRPNSVPLIAPLAFCLAVQGASIAAAQRQPPIRAGWAENVVFPKLGLKLNAKLDTGARTSSLHAVDIVRFERDGKPWVRFTTGGETVERPVKRFAVIRRAGTAPDERPVVLLSACVAGIQRLAEFNLTSRADMRYPVLIGRSFLRGDILVDASQRNLRAGTCGQSD